MVDYIHIGVLLTAILLMAGWMFISSRQHYSIKMVASVIAVVLAIGIWTKSTALIGYPVHGFPPDGSVVLALQADSSEIAFWIDGKPPRSYVIPYDDKLAKSLQGAQNEARNSGGRMIFHINKKTGGNGGSGKNGNDTGNGGLRGGGSRSGDGTGFNDNSPPVYIDVVPVFPQKD